MGRKKEEGRKRKTRGIKRRKRKERKGGGKREEGLKWDGRNKVSGGLGDA